MPPSARDTLRCSRPAGALLALLVLACGGNGPTGENPGGVGDFIVNLVPARQLAFVSLAPDAVPGGRTVSLRNPARNASADGQFSEGGFDPVAISASVGDSLTAIIATSNGTTTRVIEVGPPRSLLRVVRVSPPSGATDVPLNPSIGIVFSEPIDPASLAGQPIRLRSGTQDVALDVVIVPNHTTMVAGTPRGSLRPGTAYTLVIGVGVQGESGAGLEREERSAFTTGSQAATVVWGAACDGSLISDWLAYRDGDGPWVAPAKTAGLYRFSLNADRGIIAVAGNIPESQNTFMYVLVGSPGTELEFAL